MWTIFKANEIVAIYLIVIWNMSEIEAIVWTFRVSLLRMQCLFLWLPLHFALFSICLAGIETVHRVIQQQQQQCSMLQKVDTIKFEVSFLFVWFHFEHLTESIPDTVAYHIILSIYLIPHHSIW